MSRKIKNLFKLIFLYIFLIIFSKNLNASEEFQVDYTVYYRLSLDQKVLVTQNISLTNKFSNLYATQYSLILEGVKVKNVTAHDEKGELKTSISADGKQTVINFQFNQEVVGKGKTQNFSVSYEALNLLEKRGNVWEITIPHLAKENLPDSYVLYLEVPLEMGLPAYIKPSPVEKKTENNLNIYRFEKNQLVNSSISAAFGNFQVFNFKINYYLKNQYNQLTEAEIPLVPDTAFQQVTYLKIEPQPETVVVDNDGNWLAKYFLNPNQELRILTEGKVKVFSEPRKNFPPQGNLENNLLPQKYWEVDHPLIRQKAKELKTPKKIYDFVVQTLEYDKEKIKGEVERLGALEALNNPKKAICTEFTDLFVALARAAGVPAREINGYAYSRSDDLQSLSLTTDVLHSWPEYWDNQKKMWIPVDPTWGKTTGGIDYFSKMDLNHVVFVIHGEDSEKPYPPGSYKIEEKNKDIEIEVGEYLPEVPPQIQVDFLFSPRLSWFNLNKEKILIKNLGPTAFYNLKLELKKENLQVKSVTPSLPSEREIFPPFAKEEFLLELRPVNLLPNLEGKIILSVDGKNFEKIVEINPLIYYFGGGIGGLILIFILTRLLHYGKNK
ncbi:MAG: transglutaminase domain-containing protein [Microgenomates group bacterium]